MDYISNHRTIYIYGKTNIGKTTSVLKYLKTNNYEYQYCSIQNIKNETEFLDLLKNQNIFNMMSMNKNERVIVIDNIDSLQNNDKKILGIIIKHLKKENKSNKVMNSVKFIFIGINFYDKKVVELFNIVDYVHNLENTESFTEVDKNIKDTCKDLLTKNDVDYFKICEKTIISLVYHENIIFYANQDPQFYYTFLRSFVNGDYYDRISFQRQLWQFGEMTFFLKVINNYINFFQQKWDSKIVSDIVFTKILTKYSNEYSNLNFIINMCSKFNCQKIELIHNLTKGKYKEKLSQNEQKRLEKLLL